MIISIIVAVAENGVIGSDNRLPWRLPDDLKRFKALSLGKPVVMGRRTFESIGRPLPGRTNIVVSRQPGLAIEGAIVAPSLDAALAAAGAVPEVVVIGGADIFRQALPRTDTIHLTRVHARVAGDVLFPGARSGECGERPPWNTTRPMSVISTPSASSPCRESDHDALRLSQVPGLLLQPRPHRGERLRHPAPGAALRPERGRGDGALHLPLPHGGGATSRSCGTIRITSTSRCAASSTARRAPAPCTRRGRTCAGAIRTARSAGITIS